MSIRIKAAKFIIRLGRMIQSLAVAAMHPDDLIEFNRRYYSKSEEIQDWSNEHRIQNGLNDQERSLLTKTGISGGKLLLLGLGGGREAIPLSKMGFEVTGIDFISEMVERAKINAEKSGVKINCLVQEISKLDLPQKEYDIVWLSAAMYSSVPTRKRRLGMLKRISQILKPGGYFIFGFLWRPEMKVSAMSIFLKKMTALLTMGNLWYEEGDILRFNQEFFHAFTTIEQLEKEINNGGFELIDTLAIERYEFADALARKLI